MFVFNLLVFASCKRQLLFEEPYACDFKCWMSKLNITIDYYETTTSSGFLHYNLTLRNLTIHNMDLLDIESSYYPNPDKIEDGLKLSLKANVAIGGNLRLYQTAPTHSFDQSGSFSATASGVHFSVTLHFEKDENGLIKKVNVIEGTCGASIDRIDDPVLHITTSAFLDWLINLLKGLIVSIIKNNVGSMVCNNLQELLGEEITNGFQQANDIIKPYFNYTKPIDIPIGPNMTDLRKSDLVDVARFILSNFTGTNGPLNLNSLFNRFTNGTGLADLQSILAYFNYTKPLFFSVPIDNLKTRINLSIVDLHLSGLNSWDDFTIFEPIGPYILDTHTGMKDFGFNLTFQVNVSSNGPMITTGDAYLSETADFDIALSNNKMDMKLQVASPEGSGVNFSNAQTMNLECLETLISSEGTGITYLLFNTSITHLSLEAQTHEMEMKIREFINSVVKFFIENYRPVIPTFVTGFVNNFGTVKLNQLLDEQLANASCKDVEDAQYSDFTLWSTAVAGGGSLLLIFIIFFIMPKSKSKDDRSFDSLTYPMIESMQSLDKPLNLRSIELPTKVHKTFWEKLFRTDSEASMLMTPRLSIVTRIFMPFLILINIAVFISSNTGIGASVFAKIFMGDKHVAFPSIMDFGLINSIRDMWKAKTYALSILIAVMSCAWPYTKLIMMLIVWILPGPIMNAKRRETWLKVLDALGKWSLVDSFVMILMLIAFNFDVYFPIISGMIDSPVSVHLWVYPAYGFLTLMLGTVFSLALSHILLAIARYADNPGYSDEGEDAKRRISVFQFSEYKSICVIVGVLLVIALGLVSYGITVDSFSFDFVGLVGYALDMLDKPHKKIYSVIDLAILLPQAAENPKQFTIKFTQALYIIVAIIVPILHIITQLILFFVPMKRKIQRSFYIATEYFYAWNCLDVFIISILAAVLEISQFAAFMVGDKCDVINPLVRMFFSNEPLIKGHEVCFDVVTRLEKGSWILFGAALIHTVATVILSKVSEKVINARNGDLVDASIVSFVR